MFVERLLATSCPPMRVAVWVRGEAKRYMAVGQGKVLAPRTYGVVNGDAATTSPDSSGSPQQRAELPLVQGFD